MNAIYKICTIVLCCILFYILYVKPTPVIKLSYDTGDFSIVPSVLPIEHIAPPQIGFQPIMDIPKVETPKIEVPIIPVEIPEAKPIPPQPPISSIEKKKTILEWFITQPAFKMLPDDVIKQKSGALLKEYTQLVSSNALDNELKPRWWHDNVGYYDLHATLYEISGGRARLIKDDGNICSIKIDYLSSGDRMYLERIVKISTEILNQVTKSPTTR